MKTRISGKRVLEKLCGEYNTHSMACGYYHAVGDKESEKECEIGRKAIAEAVRCTFELSDDYYIHYVEVKSGDIKFTYMRMEVVES